MQDALGFARGLSADDTRNAGGRGGDGGRGPDSGFGLLRH
jgi:hypothetical protein